MFAYTSAYTTLLPILLFIFVRLFLLTLLNLAFLTTLQMSMNAKCLDHVQKIPFAITLLAPLNALAMMVL